MALYEYKAKNKSGGLVTGSLESESRELVATQLDLLGYFPILIREKSRPLFSFKRGGPPARIGRVRSEDLILFNRQMATLLSAGIPFIRSLDAIAEQTESKKLRQVMQDLRFRVEGGSSFSDAVAAHPKIYSELYVNMIRAGEEGGMLDTIMDRLATLSEHDAITKSRVKAALRYPAIVVAALAGAFAVLMWLVVPQFVKVFNRFNAELPMPTRILIGMDYVTKHYWWLVIILLAGLVALVRWILSTEKGRLAWDRFKLRLPIFGVLFTKVAMSRFARVFGSLIATGIPILQTLDIASKTVGNVHIEKIIQSIRDSVREGESIAAPMGMSGAFPPIVTQMVAVGEETGRLDEMLLKVSEYYDTEVEFAIRNLTTALEPLLIFFIGGVVLFLALAIFLPWWNLVNVIK